MLRCPLLSLSVLALLAFAACGDEPPEVASPEDLRLEIVSGDHQVAPVAEVAPSGALVPAQEIPENVLPERLVARITIDGAEPSPSVAGPSFAVLPANTSVTYHVVQPDVPGSAEPCGRSFIASAIPDDSGYVATYWERGTWAGECEMQVRLVNDSGPVIDTIFEATFVPGPVAGFQPELPSDGSVSHLVEPGDTIDARPLIYRPVDAHGNDVPIAEVLALPDSAVAWTWYDQVELGGDWYGLSPTGTGWAVPVPTFDSYTVGYDGEYHANLVLWLNGKPGGFPVSFVSVP